MELTNKEKIEKIREYQENGMNHPLICGCYASADYVPFIKKMNAAVTIVALRCPACEGINYDVPEEIYSEKK